MKKDRRIIKKTWSIDSKVSGISDIELTFSGRNKNDNPVECVIHLNDFDFKNLIGRLKKSKEVILENLNNKYQSMEQTKL